MFFIVTFATSAGSFVGEEVLVLECECFQALEIRGINAEERHIGLLQMLVKLRVNIMLIELVYHFLICDFVKYYVVEVDPGGSV